MADDHLGLHHCLFMAGHWGEFFVFLFSLSSVFQFSQNLICTFKINICHQLLMPLMSHCACGPASASSVQLSLPISCFSQQTLVNAKRRTEQQDKPITIFPQNTFLDPVICGLGSSLSQKFSSEMFAIRIPHWTFLTWICHIDF